LIGIKLVGVNADNWRKLLFSIAFVLVVVVLSRILKLLAKAILGERRGRVHFWVRQTIRIFTTGLLAVGLVSIWFNDPARLASAAALVTAGLAIASQRMFTAVAGYFIILQGKSF